MQHSPVRRTLRFIGFSIGFVLFVMLAFRSAHQVSDPRFIKGKPYLFGRPQAATVVSNVDDMSLVSSPLVVAAKPTNNSAPATAPQGEPAVAKTNEHANKAEPVTGSKHVPASQAASVQRSEHASKD